ncbi:hypothetical protein ABFX02_09G053200 [Erythranthe guttata]
MEHKRKLKEEYGIEPWTFVQRLGDAVLVPAGFPHQARNLKSCTSISIDFVSAESVGQCIRLSTEYRRLPKYHSFKEDKLQVCQKYDCLVNKQNQRYIMNKICLLVRKQRLWTTSNVS